MSPLSFSQAISFGLATVKTSYLVSLLPRSVLRLCSSHSCENAHFTKSRPSSPSLVLSSLVLPKTLILKIPNLTLARRAIHDLAFTYVSNFTLLTQLTWDICYPSDWKTLPSTCKTHSHTSGLFSNVTLTIPFKIALTTHNSISSNLLYVVFLSTSYYLPI